MDKRFLTNILLIAILALLLAQLALALQDRKKQPWENDPIVARSPTELATYNEVVAIRQLLEAAAPSDTAAQPASPQPLAFRP